MALKLNVNGSSKGNPGSSGVGCFVRDGSAKVLLAVSLYFGFGDSVSAELKALLKGLKL